MDLEIDKKMTDALATILRFMTDNNQPSMQADCTLDGNIVVTLQIDITDISERGDE